MVFVSYIQGYKVKNCRNKKFKPNVFNSLPSSGLMMANCWKANIMDSMIFIACGPWVFCTVIWQARMTPSALFLFIAIFNTLVASGGQVPKGPGDYNRNLAPSCSNTRLACPNPQPSHKPSPTPSPPKAPITLEPNGLLEETKISR